MNHISVEVLQPAKKEKHADHYNEGQVVTMSNDYHNGFILCVNGTFQIYVNYAYVTASTHYEKAIGKLLTLMSDVSNQN